MIIEVFDRQAQVAAFEQLLAGAEGPLWCTVSGEAGSGKSTLLDQFAERAAARGCTVLRTGLGELESHLTWAGLRVLLSGIAPSVWSRVEDGSVSAVRVAGGLEDGDLDAVRVGLGLTHVFERLSADSTLVVLIDDLHWLDQATAGALLSVAPRLTTGRLVVVAAHRPVEIAEPARGLTALGGPSFAVPGLSVASVRLLLMNRAGVRVDRSGALKVHGATGGHPLHVLEVGRLMATGRGLDDALGHPSAYEMIAERFSRLSGDTRRALLLAALTSGPTVERLVDAAPDLAVHDALESALQQHFVTRLSPAIEFAHPLVAAAAVALAAPVEQRAAHAALASTWDDTSGTWLHHRISAADGPDAALAGAVDDAVGRAVDHDDPRGALALSLAAIDLTPPSDVPAMVERLLTAADVAVLNGDVALPLQLVERAERLDSSEDTVFRAGVTRVIVTGNSGADAEATAVTDELLARLAASPTKVARIHDLRAQIAVSWDHRVMLDAAERSLDAAEQGGDGPQIERAHALLALARVLAGEPVDFEDAQARLRAAPDGSVAEDWLREVFTFGCPGPSWIDDDMAQLQAYIDAGTVLAESPARQRLAADLLAAGRYHEAVEQYVQWLELQHLIGTTRTSAIVSDMAFAHAVLGHAERARALLRDAMTGDHATVDSMDVFSRACEIHLIDGDPAAAAAAAVTAAERAREMGCGALRPCTFRAEGVVALAAAGRLAEAREFLDDLTRVVERSRHPLGAADVARATAALAAAEGRLDDAVVAWTAGVEEYGRVGHPLETARCMLGLGSALRRIGRRREAGAWLRRSLEEFERLGAVPFVQAARAEAERMGERRGSAADELTPAEEQVADLVAEGRSNSAIAGALGITAKTVESHLTRIYRKLGAQSRTELAAIRAASVKHPEG